MARQLAGSLSIGIVALAMLLTNVPAATAEPGRKTEVSIRGEMFYINGRPTYEGRVWQGQKIEGLLMNSRLVRGIFFQLLAEITGGGEVSG